MVEETIYNPDEIEDVNPDAEYRLARGKFARRKFLISGGVGAAVATITGYLLDRLGDSALGALVDAEKQYKDLEQKALTLAGALNRKIDSEVREFEEEYVQGRLGLLVDYELADPADLKDLTEKIEKVGEYADHYDFAERGRIALDRLADKLYGVGSDIYDRTPDVGKDLEHSWFDRLARGLAKATGQEYEPRTREQGAELTKTFRARIRNLCDIYETNEDNLRAQTEVLRDINDYVARTPELSPEERQLYEFIRDEYEKANSGDEFRRDSLREFITGYGRNFDSVDARNRVLLRARESLLRTFDEAEVVYERIRDDKKSLSELQELLDEGISLVEKERTQFRQKTLAYNHEIDERYHRISDYLDGIISDLEGRGIDIETMEETRNSGFLTTRRDMLTRHEGKIAYILGALVGALFGLRTYHSIGKGDELKASKRALEAVAEKGNRNAQIARNLRRGLDDKEETERHINSDNPKYCDGGGI
ncbi:hypothetical protein GF386_00815 [Candidatus Pacearchaeota archaeon]|nr:hypothetical protein [Candidatus Pacearchaeota archaeon]MBD3282799.1 hypothetical protein [Candidatus Pacearchaeota archaeon]